jgi:sugar diacid utilization regulator
MTTTDDLAVGSPQRAAEVLRRSSGRLATAATAQMDDRLPWFGDLAAQERAWVGTIVQAGIKGFVGWYAGGSAGQVPPAPDSGPAMELFGRVPRTLAGIISLRQTVDLIKLTIDVVEGSLDDLLDPEDRPGAKAAIARYAREIAFATAEVYARAAEVRGAWDARLEALVVDAVLRAEADEAVLSRASALGWHARGDLAVVLGAAPERADAALFDEIRRLAKAADCGPLDALCAVQGDRLVVVLGGVDDPRAAAAAVSTAFGDGAVVVGPMAPDLAHAHVSARAALSAFRAAGGWPDAPRPALSEEFLPERVLAGDGHARRHLIDEVYVPLAHAGGSLTETLTAYVAAGGSIEGTGRALFVHPNTVRYRLRRVADLTAFDPMDPRDALALQIALVLGRQSGRAL